MFKSDSWTDTHVWVKVKCRSSSVYHLTDHVLSQEILSYIFEDNNTKGYYSIIIFKKEKPRQKQNNLKQLTAIITIHH